MKRFWIKFLLGAALILLIGVALKPEYKVIHQLRITGGDYTRTTVSVVVKHVIFQKQLDRLAVEVIREHRRINYDTPTNEITLKVYRSVEDFEEGEEWTEYFFIINGQEAWRFLTKIRRIRWFS